MSWKAGLLALCLALAPLNQAASWGSAGHSVIAEIAQRRLHPGVLREIKTLLEGDASLSSIAGWPDQLVFLRPDTVSWHFVNIPYDATGYEPERDCRTTPAGDCVIRAIERAHATLADTTAPKSERVEALAFLVHFVGDVHQPMHAADRGDNGGNRTLVTFFERPMSLHMVWDVGLIEKRTFDWGEYVRHIEQNWLPGQDVEALGRGNPADWAWEAHVAAVEVAYALPEDLTLGDDYYRRSLPVVERQLAVAGLRLARMLNEIFGEADFLGSSRVPLRSIAR